MKRHSVIRLLLVVAFGVVCSAPVQVSQYSFQFEQTPGITVDVLSPQGFDAAFGNNPDVPLSDDEVIRMAESLFPPYWESSTETPSDGEICREYEVGVLFAALSNPDISTGTRQAVDTIISQAAPPLPKTYVSGHFKFYYTDNNAVASHNVTLNQVKATAVELNKEWNTYATNFKEPKYKLVGGKKMIDIKVWYLGAGLNGETSSAWDYINLNSALVVSNDCKRKTTSAHELFHRVQYSYGYASGTANMKWIVEGTAAWSQAYTNRTVRDYMGRMNSGLLSPDTALLTVRSYDAAHFWVYLEKRTNSAAIRDVWARYQINGKDPKAAVGTVVQSRLNVNFEGYVRYWIKANYLKDLANSGSFDYTEDETSATSCGIAYGPLSHVPRTSANIAAIAPTATWTNSSSVSKYGARYYELNLAADLEDLQIKVAGAATGDYSFHFIGIKGNSSTSILDVITGTTYTYSKKLTKGQWDKVGVIVGGRAKGGAFTITVGGNLAGTWDVSENYGSNGRFTAVWTVTQTNTSLVVNGVRPGGYRASGTGTVSGSAVTVRHSCYGVGCGTCTYSFTGTVGATGRTMSGPVVYSCPSGFRAPGTWSATKRSSALRLPSFPLGAAASVQPNPVPRR